MTHAISVSVYSTTDIVTARQRGRELAAQVGFSPSDATIIATAISEVARNIVEHATAGEVAIRKTDDGQRTGVQVVARDQGPGILNPASAVKVGDAGDESGLGLFGTRSLMDEFDVASQVGHGTTVTMVKWLN